MHVQWWQLLTTGYKKASNQMPFLTCWEQKQVLPVIPAHGTTEGVGRSPKLHAFCLTHGSAPALTTFKGMA